MKYLILLCDGMSDYPTPSLGNHTPMELAYKPSMDELGLKSFSGLVRTIPEGILPGSDTANMSVMGYDPRLYYTGRSPIEAVSMGIDLSDSDVAYRVNLVTLSEETSFPEKTMLDYSSDEISSDEAKVLIHSINQHIAHPSMRFFPGKSYRNCLVWENGPDAISLTPPHDILTQKIGKYLPSPDLFPVLYSMMATSCEILKDHPINEDRIRRGLLAANAIWIWGQGKRPSMPNLSDKYPVRGCVIAAVDLIFGLGILSGLHPIQVEGATGNIHTNFTGKANAAIDEFKHGTDYIYLHIEAPDECGHRNEPENKVRSIELIDEKVLAPILRYFQNRKNITGEDYKILVLPDHPTPLTLRTHTADPVPFILYSSKENHIIPVRTYTEKECASTGVFIQSGPELFDLFMRHDG